jgi:hypothetical protein
VRCRQRRKAPARPRIATSSRHASGAVAGLTSSLMVPAPGIRVQARRGLRRSVPGSAPGSEPRWIHEHAGLGLAAREDRQVFEAFAGKVSRLLHRPPLTRDSLQEFDQETDEESIRRFLRV